MADERSLPRSQPRPPKPDLTFTFNTKTGESAVIDGGISCCSIHSDTFGARYARAQTFVKRLLTGSTIVAIAAVVIGCNDARPKLDTSVPSDSTRFKTVYAATVRVNAGDYRSILVLRDNKTGKEYLAVYGAGVTEMHQATTTNGKSTVTHWEED